MKERECRKASLFDAMIPITCLILFLSLGVLVMVHHLMYH